MERLEGPLGTCDTTVRQVKRRHLPSSRLEVTKVVAAGRDFRPRLWLFGVATTRKVKVNSTSEPAWPSKKIPTQLKLIY
jgi:hypothetical protein